MSEDWRDETMNDRQAVAAGASESEGDQTNPGAVVAPPQVVVVAVDFSMPARRAMAWAIDHALHAPITLHTVHVVDRRFQLGDLSVDPAALRGELNDAERAAAVELARLGDEARARVGAVHEHVAFGRPADEIVRVARELGAQLIVIGSHGRDAISHALLGSVAERVVRGADCPVVVVKDRR